MADQASERAFAKAKLETYVFIVVCAWALRALLLVTKATALNLELWALTLLVSVVCGAKVVHYSIRLLQLQDSK